jgi:flagellin
MVINHNIAALNTYNQLKSNSSQLTRSLQELSSGLRINSAADDASGYTISQQMTGQVNGLNQAVNNAQDDNNLIQTADGALSTTANILQTMRTLAVQSSDDTNTTSDRAALQSEVNQLGQQITNIANNTQFNGMVLLSGKFATNGLIFQIGANSGQTMTLTISAMTAKALSVSGKSGGISISTSAGAANAISTITLAIQSVTKLQSKFGAVQNRLSDTISNLTNIAQNLTAASSQITDVDMAQEMTSYSQLNIINQSATAMLSQAQQLPQGVLKLLQNV